MQRGVSSFVEIMCFDRSLFFCVFVLAGKKDTKELKDLKQAELSALFQSVNALLNSGGGMLYLHVASKYLHFLDEQVGF
jgi:hypothetical protein